MRKGGGKAKGASFEREICHKLSLWVSGGKHEDVFWRSAMSGGRSTVASTKGKRLSAQAGDISCVHPAGHAFSAMFMCECKFYSDLNIQGIINGTGKLLEFWETAKAESQRYDKMPMLIAKQNRQSTIICVSTDGRDALISTLILPLFTVPSFDLHAYNADGLFLTVPPPK